MSKLRIGVDDEKIMRIIIDAMLSKHGTDFDHVKENPKINGINWFQYYTWNTAEESHFKEWFISFFQNSVSPRYPKDRLEKEWGMFQLMWGLKVVD